MRPAAGHLGVLALVCTAVLWGSNHVIARGATEIVPLPAFVFWRWALALPPMLVIAWPSIRRHRATIRADLADICLIGALGVGLFSTLLIAGAYYSSAIEVSMIYSTSPAWVAVIGLVAGADRLAPRQWLGLVGAFTGTLLILTQGDPAMILTLEARAGHLLTLGAAILFAWFSVRLRGYSGRLPPFTLTTLTATAGTLIVCLPYYLVSTFLLGSGFVAAAPDLRSAALLIVAVAAIGPTLIGNACFVYGLSVIGPQKAAAFLYLSPVASSVLAVIVLGERLHLYHLAGYVLIVTGLVLVNLRARVARQG